MFRELKTAQATAYLLHKAGGTMEHLKMMKLLYLADRRAWELYGHSITGDEYYSLPFGPVLSNTLNLMRGESPEFYQPNSGGPWSEWIADKADHKISLKKEINLEDEYFWSDLSESDEEILDEIFVKFGDYKTFALVEYTHNPKYIPEWEDPKGGAKKITLENLLKALGKEQEEIQAIIEHLEEIKAFDELFSGKR